MRTTVSKTIVGEKRQPEGIRAARTGVPMLVAIAAGGLAACTAPAPGPGEGGATRTYYIAAEEVVWDYAPSGLNQISGRPFGEMEAYWMEPGPTFVGRTYKKAIYREYTDSTFATPVTRPPEWEHLGILGPLVRAVVGDTVRIVYRNAGRHRGAR